MLKNGSPAQSYRKEPPFTFSTLIVGPDRSGDQTRATCVAGSGASRSAIHYNAMNRF
jgi:hypothetical protein